MSVALVQHVERAGAKLQPRQSLLNTFDHQLERLFKAAGRTRGETVLAISGVSEERAMASWANGIAADNRFFWAVPLLRRALALAYAVALAAVVFHCYEPAPPAADEVAIVNASISLSYSP
jgi:hypothetical protein